MLSNLLRLILIALWRAFATSVAHNPASYRTTADVAPRDVDLKPVQDRLTVLSRDVDNHNLLLWSMIAQGNMPVIPMARTS